MKKHIGFVVAIGAVMVVACAPKANKDDCEKMVDKMIDVQLQGQSKEIAAMTKKMMQGDRDKLLNECVGKATKSEVECVLKAKTQADVEKCG